MIFNLKSLIIKMIQIILASVMLIHFSSCSKFLKGKPQSKKVLQFNTEELECVKGLKTQGEQLLDNQLSENDIVQITSCVDKALEKLSQNIKGRESLEYYNQDDIYEIFKKLFKSEVLTKDIIQEIFYFKKALIGGTDETLAHSEIIKIRNLIKILSSEVLKNYQFIGFYTKLSTQIDNSKIAPAMQQLNQSLKIIFHETKLIKSNYSFEDFYRFIQHFITNKTQLSDLTFYAELLRILIIGDVKQLYDQQLDYVITNVTDTFRFYLNNKQKLEKIDLASLSADDQFGLASEAIKVVKSFYRFNQTQNKSLENTDVQKIYNLLVRKYKSVENFQVIDFFQFKKLIFGGSLTNITDEDLTVAENRLMQVRSFIKENQKVIQAVSQEAMGLKIEQLTQKNEALAVTQKEFTQFNQKLSSLISQTQILSFTYKQIVDLLKRNQVYIEGFIAFDKIETLIDALKLLKGDELINTETEVQIVVKNIFDLLRLKSQLQSKSVRTQLKLDNQSIVLFREAIATISSFYRFKKNTLSNITESEWSIFLKRMKIDISQVDKVKSVFSLLFNAQTLDLNLAILTKLDSMAQVIQDFSKTNSELWIKMSGLISSENKDIKFSLDEQQKLKELVLGLLKYTGFYSKKYTLKNLLIEIQKVMPLSDSSKEKLNQFMSLYDLNYTDSGLNSSEDLNQIFNFLTQIQKLQIVTEQFSATATSINNLNDFNSQIPSLNSLLEALSAWPVFTQNKGLQLQDVLDLLQKMKTSLKLSDDGQKQTQMQINQVKHLFKLKAALFSSSEQLINRDDLVKLQDLLNKNTAYLKYFAQNEDVLLFKSGDQNLINQVFTKLEECLHQNIDFMSLEKSQYTLNDFYQLLDEFKILSDESGQKNREYFKNVLKLVKGDILLDSKNLLKNTSSSLSGLARIYAQIKQKPLVLKFMSSEQLDENFAFFENILKVIYQTPQIAHVGFIEFKNIDVFIDDVLKFNVLPGLTKETLTDFYKTLLQKVFEIQYKNQTLTSFTKLALENIYQELLVYKNSQKIISDFSKTKSSYFYLADWVKFLAKVDFNSFKISNPIIPVDLNKINLIVQKLTQADLREKPVLYRNKKVILAGNQNLAQLNWLDLTESLYAKMLTRELMIGWGKLDLSISSEPTYLMSEGLVQWYADFKKFGIEVKLFDPRETNAGAENFMYANLFTYSGNGDDKLNFSEMHEYVSLLLSGGGLLTQEMLTSAVENNCALNELDVFNQPKLNENCMREVWVKNYETYYSNLFSLPVYFRSLARPDLENYFNQLMSISKRDPSHVGVVEMADIRKFNMMTYFIESLIGQFDTVKIDNQLEQKEIRNAYPRFKQFVTQFAHKKAADSLEAWGKWYNVCNINFNQDDLLKESFVFLLYNGRMPVLQDFSIKNCLFSDKLFDFGQAVSRKTLLSTFKVLNDDIRSKK